MVVFQAFWKIYLLKLNKLGKDFESSYVSYFQQKRKKGKPLQPIICVGKCSDIFTKKMNISYFMWNELTCFFDIIITVWKIVGLECKVSIYHFPYLCCRWNLEVAYFSRFSWAHLNSAWILHFMVVCKVLNRNTG